MADKKLDWESIEKDYRAGVKSLASIARIHDCSDTAIRKRAKKYGWQRDLSREVRKATRSKLVRVDGSDANPNPNLDRTDAEIVESASSEVAQVVVGHRTQITEWKGIASNLAGALADIEVNGSNHNEFARSLNSGVDALGKLIKLERQAYCMDEDAEPEETPEAKLSDAELDAEIARLRAKVGDE